MESYSRDAPPTRETRPQNFFSLSSPPPPSWNRLKSIKLSIHSPSVITFPSRLDFFLRRFFFSIAIFFFFLRRFRSLDTWWSPFLWKFWSFFFDLSIHWLIMNYAVAIFWIHIIPGDFCEPIWFCSNFYHFLLIYALSIIFSIYYNNWRWFFG